MRDEQEQSDDKFPVGCGLLIIVVLLLNPASIALALYKLLCG